MPRGDGTQSRLIVGKYSPKVEEASPVTKSRPPVGRLLVCSTSSMCFGVKVRAVFLSCDLLHFDST